MAGNLKPYVGWARNLLRLDGTELPPPMLLAAKLAVVCLVLRMTWRDLPNPFLPFVPAFDYFRHTPFGWGLKAAVLIGSAAVLFNYRVRAACLLIGSAFLVGILASRPYFENNIMYLGCLLFLLGLYEPRTGPWLIRAQIIVVFFAAALNKLLDANWRSGEFFDYWASVYVNKSFYFRLGSWLPEMLLARTMSWMTIFIEFGIALGLLFRRSRVWAIWLGLLLATGQNFLTERTFGVFFYVMPISYLTFVAWPRSKGIVLYDGDCGFCTRVRRLMERFDIEGLFSWKPFQFADDLHGISEDALRQRLYVVVENKNYSGFAAFKIMALYNPLTYFVLLLPLLLPQGVFFHHRSWLVITFLLLFSPVFAPVGEALYAWIARNRYRIPTRESCPAPTISQRQ
jgi:predicted DCC family thiol-disulfide oxidoreductase YuxK